MKNYLSVLKYMVNIVFFPFHRIFIGVMWEVLALTFLYRYGIFQDKLTSLIQLLILN